MKQDNRTTRELAPDFIADMETPEGFKVTKLNDAEYMGERYGWSSNAKGWFRLSEHPEQPIKEAVICEHCGKDKKVITGLCPHCGKFPAIKEQSSNREEGFTKIDEDFLMSALNSFWHQAHTALQRKDLGDIERENYQFEKDKARVIMNELEENGLPFKAENKRLKERIEVLEGGLNEVANKTATLRDGVKSNSPADAQISEVWTIAKEALTNNNPK